MSDGHEAAADTVIARVLDAIDLGIEELTLYAFSTENWSRPADEVTAVLAMLARRIDADTSTLHAHDVRLRFIGRRDRTGEALASAMRRAEGLTGANAGMRVYVALDYGGRHEIVSAAKRYHGGGEAAFSRLLHAADMHDPDLIIRTSGEQRLSNFLLWQAAHAELVFREEMWPDFTRRSLEQSLAEYAARRHAGAAAI